MWLTVLCNETAKLFLLNAIQIQNCSGAKLCGWSVFTGDWMQILQTGHHFERALCKHEQNLPEILWQKTENRCKKTRKYKGKDYWEKNRSTARKQSSNTEQQRCRPFVLFFLFARKLILQIDERVFKKYWFYYQFTFLFKQPVSHWIFTYHG